MCLAFAGLAFISCEKEDNNDVANGFIADGKISVSVENGASYSSKVDSIFGILSYKENNIWYDDIVVKAPYGNGIFTIDLPLNVSAKHFEEYEVESGITISDPTVKRVAFYEFSAIKSGYLVGHIYRSNISPEIRLREEEFEIASTDGILEACYVYVDKPVTIKGSVEKEFEDDYNGEKYNYISKHSYNISLLKGWNVMFYKRKLIIANNKITSETREFFNSPEPAGLKWYIYTYPNTTNTISAKSGKHKLF
jgi:hypothetical protein